MTVKSKEANHGAQRKLISLERSWERRNGDSVDVAVKVSLFIFSTVLYVGHLAAEKLPNFSPQCNFEMKKNSTNKGAADDFFQKWQNNIVPYKFDSSFSSTDRQTFLKASQQIATASCVSFIEGTASQYLYVTREAGCVCGGNCFDGGHTAGLGAASPRTLTISSACLNPNSQFDIGFMVHEIMHALGIIHTQRRPDR